MDKTHLLDIITGRLCTAGVKGTLIKQENKNNIPQLPPDFISYHCLCPCGGFWRPEGFLCGAEHDGTCSSDPCRPAAAAAADSSLCQWRCVVHNEQETITGFAPLLPFLFRCRWDKLDGDFEALGDISALRQQVFIERVQDGQTGWINDEGGRGGVYRGQRGTDGDVFNRQWASFNCGHMTTMLGKHIRLISAHGTLTTLY